MTRTPKPARKQEMRSIKSRAVRAVRRIINEQAETMELDKLTSMVVFLLALRGVRL